MAGVELARAKPRLALRVPVISASPLTVALDMVVVANVAIPLIPRVPVILVFPEKVEVAVTDKVPPTAILSNKELPITSKILPEVVVAEPPKTRTREVSEG